jgi:hypothetical protein
MVSMTDLGCNHDAIILRRLFAADEPAFIDEGLFGVDEIPVAIGFLPTCPAIAPMRTWPSKNALLAAFLRLYSFSSCLVLLQGLSSS